MERLTRDQFLVTACGNLARLVSIPGLDPQRLPLTLDLGRELLTSGRLSADEFIDVAIAAGYVAAWCGWAAWTLDCLERAIEVAHRSQLRERLVEAVSHQILLDWVSGAETRQHSITSGANKDHLGAFQQTTQALYLAAQVVCRKARYQDGDDRAVIKTEQDLIQEALTLAPGSPCLQALATWFCPRATVTNLRHHLEQIPAGGQVPSEWMWESEAGRLRLVWRDPAAEPGQSSDLPELFWLLWHCAVVAERRRVSDVELRTLWKAYRRVLETCFKLPETHPPLTHTHPEYLFPLRASVKWIAAEQALRFAKPEIEDADLQILKEVIKRNVRGVKRPSRYLTHSLPAYGWEGLAGRCIHHARAHPDKLEETLETLLSWALLELVDYLQPGRKLGIEPLLMTPYRAQADEGLLWIYATAEPPDALVLFRSGGGHHGLVTPCKRWIQNFLQAGQNYLNHCRRFEQCLPHGKSNQDQYAKCAAADREGVLAILKALRRCLEELLESDPTLNEFIEWCQVSPRRMFWVPVGAVGPSGPLANLPVPDIMADILALPAGEVATLTAAKLRNLPREGRPVEPQGILLTEFGVRDEWSKLGDFWKQIVKCDDGQRRVDQLAKALCEPCGTLYALLHGRSIRKMLEQDQLPRFLRRTGSGPERLFLGLCSADTSEEFGSAVNLSFTTLLLVKGCRQAVSPRHEVSVLAAEEVGIRIARRESSGDSFERAYSEAMDMLRHPDRPEGFQLHQLDCWAWTLRVV